MSILDNATVATATADEAKVTRNRKSAQPDAGVVALLKETLPADAAPKKITLPSEDAAKALVKAVKVAAASEGIGYRVKQDGVTVFVKGAPKKAYTISEESAKARAAKSAATRAAKKAAEKPAAKGGK